MSYCVCEHIPFCAISIVRYMQRYRLLKRSLTAVTIFYDCCRHHLQNKMAAPVAAVHPVKNHLYYYLSIYPTNENCSQRRLRGIMLPRNLIKILLASYSSKCY